MPRILTPEEEERINKRIKEQSRIEDKHIEKYGRHYENNEDYIKNYNVNPIKSKSPTKKEIKMLMKEVQAKKIPKKIKTDNVDKLIKFLDNKLLNI